MRATLARPGPWLFGLCFLIFAVQWQALMAWLPTFLIETQDRSLAGAALLTALFVLATALGSVGSAWLMHLGAARWLLLGIAFTGMGVCAAALFAPFTPVAAKIPLAVCFALVGGPVPSACFEGGIAHAPDAARVAMAAGFVAQGAALGAVLGPPLLAAVTDALGRLGIGMVDHAGLVFPRSCGRCRRAAGRRTPHADLGCGMTSGLLPLPPLRLLVAVAAVAALMLASGAAPAASIRSPPARSPLIRPTVPHTVSAVCTISAGWSSAAASRPSAGCRASASRRTGGSPPSATAATGSVPAWCGTAPAASRTWWRASSCRSSTRRAAPCAATGATPRRLNACRGGDILVSFESRHRVWRYAAETGGLQGPAQPFPTPKAMQSAPANGGLEALTSLADGRILMLAQTLKRDDGARAGWLVGARADALGFHTAPKFLPTDAATLPKGDVLLLSRHFSLLGGAEVRLEGIPAAAIGAGAVLRGALVAHFAPPFTVENFEGVAAVTDEDGSVLVYLLSDDNFNIFQRTLLLLFRLDLS